MSVNRSGLMQAKLRQRLPVAARIESLAFNLAEVAADRKAEDVEIIDVRGKVDYADFLVLASGRSDRHLAALARHLEAAGQELGSRVLSQEGLRLASWILMDFGDVLVHLFREDVRHYYDFGALWVDAPRKAVGT